MPSDHTPLFVRLPTADAERLNAAAAATGLSKRQIVSEAVRGHLEDNGLTVGRIALLDERPAPREEPAEVMTIEEAAALLRVDPSALRQSAARGEVPARQISGKWRLSRSALLAWLAAETE